MWTLEAYRVINSVAAWIPCGEFPTVENALNAIHSFYALEYRLQSPDGNYYEVIWPEFSDVDGNEYVMPTLGEICNYWPQFVGNVK